MEKVAAARVHAQRGRRRGRLLDGRLASRERGLFSLYAGPPTSLSPVTFAATSEPLIGILPKRAVRNGGCANVA